MSSFYVRIRSIAQIYLFEMSISNVYKCFPKHKIWYTQCLKLYEYNHLAIYIVNYTVFEWCEMLDACLYLPTHIGLQTYCKQLAHRQHESNITNTFYVFRKSDYSLYIHILYEIGHSSFYFIPIYFLFLCNISDHVIWVISTCKRQLVCLCLYFFFVCC